MISTVPNVKNTYFKKYFLQKIQPLKFIYLQLTYRQQCVGKH